jgi:phosphatidylglycerol lysyltransferase
VHFFSHHLWLIAAGGGVGVAGRYLRLYVRYTHKVILPDPRVDLLRFHQQYGYNAHALVAITSEIRVWTSRETHGAIAFKELGRVWLVAGDPFTSAENLAAIATAFVRKAHGEGRVVGFMPATERFAKSTNGLGLRAIKVGSAPYFDLSTWAPRGDRAKKARAGVNRARRVGVRVEEVVKVDDELIRETACLRKSWLNMRRSAMKFEWLFAVDLFQNKDLKKYFTARDASGTLVGFLAASPIPARDGWYLEDILHSKKAPNGTTDLLVVEVLNLLKRDGAKLATLGTAPMAMEGGIDPEVVDNPKLDQATRIAASWCSIFYNFDGVRHFKAKFAPSWWENEYILMSPGVSVPPRVFRAFVQAILPAGPSILFARQINRAWKRRRVIKP